MLNAQTRPTCAVWSAVRTMSICESGQKARSRAIRARHTRSYRASVSLSGGRVSSDTTTIKAAAINVIGTTGIRPNHASAPGVVAV